MIQREQLQRDKWGINEKENVALKTAVSLCSHFTAQVEEMTKWNGSQFNGSLVMIVSVQCTPITESTTIQLQWKRAFCQWRVAPFDQIKFSMPGRRISPSNKHLVRVLYLAQRPLNNVHLWWRWQRTEVQLRWTKTLRVHLFALGSRFFLSAAFYMLY